MDFETRCRWLSVTECSYARSATDRPGCMDEWRLRRRSSVHVSGAGLVSFEDARPKATLKCAQFAENARRGGFIKPRKSEGVARQAESGGQTRRRSQSGISVRLGPVVLRSMRRPPALGRVIVTALIGRLEAEVR